MAAATPSEDVPLDIPIPRVNLLVWCTQAACLAAAAPSEDVPFHIPSVNLLECRRRG